MDVGSPSTKVQTPISSCRYDSSLGILPSVLVSSSLQYLCISNTCRKILGLLTKKFIKLLKEAEDGVLDLNIAADTLNVYF